MYNCISNVEKRAAKTSMQRNIFDELGNERKDFLKCFVVARENEVMASWSLGGCDNQDQNYRENRGIEW